MQLTDFQKEELDALGDDKVKASLNLRKESLEKTSDKALKQLDEQLETANITETVKVFDSTNKQINVMNGIQDITLQIPLFIPGELAQHYDLEGEIQQQLKQSHDTKQTTKKPTTTRKGDTPPSTGNDSKVTPPLQSS